MGYIEANGIRYGKPNMSNLEGEWGRIIFEQIKNSPRTDFEQLRKDDEELKKRMRIARENGTF